MTLGGYKVVTLGHILYKFLGSNYNTCETRLITTFYIVSSLMLNRVGSMAFIFASLLA